ncbi:bromodomain-containing protein 4 [Drosophila teissieri]|uniref:bromodomain-containing protein 4 n=1 Tax=Drosophila teissieri TaxID=7243 RepID=UPI001CBA0B3C|nr:bromodomain-containing protein 4 [Drosophila teissieri]
MSNKRSIDSRHGSPNKPNMQTSDNGGSCSGFGSLNSDIIPTPYELMRQRNCKTEKVMKGERYPSIRPPVSKCSYEQSKNYLYESVDQGGCLDPNTTDQDALRIWKMSPHKSTLKFYGVADGLHLPEADKFNRTLTTSLKHASGSRRPAPKPPVPPVPMRPPQPAAPCQPYILNRKTLKEELQRMPIARQKLNPKEAFSMLFCDKRPDPMDPLGVEAATDKMVSLREALDMAKPEKPPKHGLRRKHWYCPSKCGEPENKCTAFEWAQYKLNPRPYDQAFLKWFLDQKLPLEREPHDYDELYKRFQGCFEVKRQPDPDCVAMTKCCPDMIKEVQDECGVEVGVGEGGGGGGAGGGGGGPGSGSGGGAQKEGGDNGGTGGKGQPGSGHGPERSQQAKDKEKEKGQTSGDKEDAGKDKSKDTAKDKDKNKEKDTGKDTGGNIPKEDKEKDKDKDKGKDKDKDTDAEKGKDKGKDKGKGKGKDKNEDEDQKHKKHNPADPDQERSMKPTKPPKQPKPPLESTTDTSTRNISSFDMEDSDEIPIREEIVEVEENEPAKAAEEPKPKPPPTGKPPKKKPPSKKPPFLKPIEKPPKEKPEKVEEKEDNETCPPCPPVGCACSICDCLYGNKIPISTTMQSIMAEEKVREKREYLRRMRHREYMECTAEKSLVPQHKVDSISCDNCFCRNPKIAEYCECLAALHHLQRLLGKERHRIVNNELIFNLDDLRQRITERMCKCL